MASNSAKVRKLPIWAEKYQCLNRFVRTQDGKATKSHCCAVNLHAIRLDETINFKLHLFPFSSQCLPANFDGGVFFHHSVSPVSSHFSAAPILFMSFDSHALNIAKTALYITCENSFAVHFSCAILLATHHLCFVFISLRCLQSSLFIAIFWIKCSVSHSLPFAKLRVICKVFP